MQQFFSADTVLISTSYQKVLNSLFSLSFSKIFKFPVFSLSGFTFHSFPCGVETLLVTLGDLVTF